MKSWFWKIAIVVFIGWALVDYNQTVNEERLKRQSIEQEFKEREKQCIVDALYHEARGEGEFGMKAVANVIYNRVQHKRFPDNYCDVINQYKQFSYTLDKKKPQGAILKGLHGDKAAYKTAEKIADEIIHGKFQGFLPASTLHYATIRVRNHWTRTKKVVAQIGNHKFYTAKEK